MIANVSITFGGGGGGGGQLRTINKWFYLREVGGGFVFKK